MLKAISVPKGCAIRYLNIPALLVRSGRRLVLKLQRDYPLPGAFVAALAHLRPLPMPAG